MRVKPLYKLLPGYSRIKIWFKDGKCEQFINHFKKLLKDVKTRKLQGLDDPDVIYHLISEEEDNLGFVDPRDPSLIFITDTINEDVILIFNNLNNFFSQMTRKEWKFNVRSKKFNHMK